jgi:hypothetical protein
MFANDAAGKVKSEGKRRQVRFRGNLEEMEGKVLLSGFHHGHFRHGHAFFSTMGGGSTSGGTTSASGDSGSSTGAAGETSGTRRGSRHGHGGDQLLADDYDHADD